MEAAIHTRSWGNQKEGADAIVEELLLLLEAHHDLGAALAVTQISHFFCIRALPYIIHQSWLVVEAHLLKAKVPVIGIMIRVQVLMHPGVPVTS